MLSVIPAPSTAAFASSFSHVVLRDPASRSLVVFDPTSHQLALYQNTPINARKRPRDEDEKESDQQHTDDKRQRPRQRHRRQGSSDSDIGSDDARVRCPACHQPLPMSLDSDDADLHSPASDSGVACEDALVGGPSMSRDYFRVLSLAFRTERDTNAAQQRHNNLLTATAEADTDSESVAVSTSESTSDDTEQAPSAHSHSHSLHDSSFLDGYQTRFFERVRKLGGGSFGCVYLTRHVLEDVTLGEYACKVIPVGDSRAWLARVCREVRALEAVRHRNIVSYKHSWLEHAKIADFGPEVPCMFLLMEYCNRGTVAELLWAKTSNSTATAEHPRRRTAATAAEAASSASPPGHLVESDVWWIFLDACSGLRHLHRCGLLHNDLKLDNLLLTEDSGANGSAQPMRVCISDFGNAILKGAQHQRTGMTGTLAYAAPETLTLPTSASAGSPYSERSDLWSLGVILYCLAFSALPYDAPTVEAMKRQIESQKLAIPALPRRSIELVALIQRLLAVDPLQRPDCEQILAHPTIQRMREQRKQQHSQHHHAQSHKTSPRRQATAPDDATVLRMSSSGSVSAPVAPVAVTKVSAAPTLLRRPLLPPADADTEVERPLDTSVRPAACHADFVSAPIAAGAAIAPSVSVSELVFHSCALSVSLASVMLQARDTEAPRLWLALYVPLVAAIGTNLSAAAAAAPHPGGLVASVRSSRGWRVHLSLAACVVTAALALAG